jgi:pSer/pThr/pTyr-binding forkhead associated (FHA) protein
MASLPGTPVAMALPGFDVEDSEPAPAPGSIHGWLQFLDAGSTRIPLTATSLRIGRHQDNDIRLPNDSVHRRHAVLHKTHSGTFVIRDLGTKNGIVVNGKRCTEHELTDNDLIELGEVRFRIVLEKPPPGRMGADLVATGK